MVKPIRHPKGDTFFLLPCECKKNWKFGGLLSEISLVITVFPITLQIRSMTSKENSSWDKIFVSDGKTAHRSPQTGRFALVLDQKKGKKL